MAGAHAREHMALTLQALIESHLADPETARNRAREALAQAEHAGDAHFKMRNLRTLGFIELSVRNPSSAYDWFAQLDRLFRDGGYGAPGVFRYHADAVEAMLAAGADKEAEQLTLWLEDHARIVQRPWPVVMASRCRGLLQLRQGRFDEGLASLERALETHNQLGQPFELGHTLLLKGVALRRAKRKQAARQNLEQARQIFDGLGSTSWSAQAVTEIERLGKRILDPSQLTPTEQRVAALVAAGLSNREVGDQLFISIKTVEASLSRIYQKLGVRSRTGLAARLTAEPKV
jgi:DNA-binding CsgD family transcriptional regulator